MPLPENSPLTLTAPSDPKVRFVENLLVSIGLRERLQTAHSSLRSSHREAASVAPKLTLVRARAIAERRHSKPWLSLRYYGALSSWPLRYSKFAGLVNQL